MLNGHWTSRSSLCSQQTQIHGVRLDLACNRSKYAKGAPKKVHDVKINNNDNGRNGIFLRGWLPHRGKAQMACNYCFLAWTMF